MGRMKILVGCEYSNTVSQAFRDRGHDAYSCDLYHETEGPSKWHYACHVWDAIRFPPCDPGVVDGYWDLIILHPDCHKMAVSGNRWYAGTKEREKAVEWTVKTWNKAIEACEKVAMENPVSVLWKALGGVTQYIHPWEYGHKETKKTGLKLHNLPPLKPTNIVGPPPPTGTEERKEWERVWRMAPSPNRSKERARFLKGWADAMADQWGSL